MIMWTKNRKILQENDHVDKNRKILQEHDHVYKNGKILQEHDHVDKNKYFSSVYVPEDGSGILSKPSSDPLFMKVPTVKTEMCWIFFQHKMC